jgi:hypothetical protein
MSYYYDNHGFACLAGLAHGEADHDAPNDSSQQWNWNGYDWIGLPLDYQVPEALASVAMPDAVVDQTEWLIDIGPFFDRFGAQQLPVLANPDPVNQAIIKTTMARKWIDLQREDLVPMMVLIKAKNVGVSDELIDEILHTPVLPAENLALRKMFFS